MMPPIPASRYNTLIRDDIQAEADYVLYWMTSARRSQYNFALQHALYYANSLGKPLVVFEPLRADYPWASDRIHQFIVEGMADNLRQFTFHGCTYLPYLEPSKGDSRGLLDQLASRACLVVADHFPSFFLPRMVASAVKRLDVRLDVVDTNGILPLLETTRIFTTAFSFRRHLQKNILQHLEQMPLAEPLRYVPPHVEAPDLTDVKRRWPMAIEQLKGGFSGSEWAHLRIDHSVAPIKQQGGSHHARKAWALFLETKLNPYLTDRNRFDTDGTSRLSPYLHFGHISVHEMVATLLAKSDWAPHRVASTCHGKRTGWWGLNEASEAFLDQVITWRELGYTFCHQRPDTYDKYESLPSWALETLQIHENDPRPIVYSRPQLEHAETHDPLWNAAQRQLVSEGRIHNYLRMLWGKKILEWSEHPRVALNHMIELNNKFAIDGRNPNSYSGIFWTLGRFDRAWGPERPIFGKVRYMSSLNTARKHKVGSYLDRWQIRPSAPSPGSHPQPITI
jgi:deoxyribodipyrimidine photo-lyase